MSMDFARSRGYPVLKHHLFPRTKGFCLMLKHLRESGDCIRWDFVLFTHMHTCTHIHEGVWKVKIMTQHSIYTCAYIQCGIFPMHCMCTTCTCTFIMHTYMHVYVYYIYKCTCTAMCCCLLYSVYVLCPCAVPAIYDVTIVLHGDDPGLLDVINAKPSSADVCVRSDSIIHSIHVYCTHTHMHARAHTHTHTHTHTVYRHALYKYNM